MIGPGNIHNEGRERGVASDTKPSWDELRDEAADWLARMDCGTASLEEFEAWRDADPRRAAAFVQVAGALATLDRLKPELQDVLPKVRTTRRGVILGGVGALAVVAGGGALFAMKTARSTVRTAVGERKAVSVPGGELTLNTDSDVQWRASPDLLQIWLRRGEVALDLTHATGLCLLHAADHVAQIGGAMVNARLRGTLLDLAVMSGGVQVLRGAKTNGPHASVVARVRPNEAVLLTGNSEVVRPLSGDDAAFLSGWQSGEMVFAGETLETAVAEYNRYLTRKIYIADPSIAGLRLGGRFSTHDPHAFLEALHQSFAIRVNDPGTGTIILTK